MLIHTLHVLLQSCKNFVTTVVYSSSSKLQTMSICCQALKCSCTFLNQNNAHELFVIRHTSETKLVSAILSTFASASSVVGRISCHRINDILCLEAKFTREQDVAPYLLTFLPFYIIIVVIITRFWGLGIQICQFVCLG
uniref:Uncharacterized protein n=1 Tax=Arundo donax TaxID=35708 RepID=A0A0A9GAR7_ARUDO